MKFPANSLTIPVSNLNEGHKLMCSDGEWRLVEKVDYVYDIDAATMSRSYALVVCSGGHKQLVKDHVYIFNADAPKQRKESDRMQKKKLKRGHDGLPIIPDDAA